MPDCQSLVGKHLYIKKSHKNVPLRLYVHHPPFYVSRFSNVLILYNVGEFMKGNWKRYMPVKKNKSSSECEKKKDPSSKTKSKHRVNLRGSAAIYNTFFYHRTKHLYQRMYKG